MYKLLAIVGCVAVALAADVTVGKDGGQIIFEKNVTASPAIWKQTQNVTVSASEDTVISQVVVIDNREDKAGEARVVEGGEGEKNVTIELKSPAVFRGFDFTVKVFAAPDSGNSHPKSTGLDQNPVKNDGDIMLGAPTSSSSTTEAANTNNQDINNPVLVGQEKTRQNRETLYEKTDEEEPIAVNASTIKTNETQDESDEDVRITLETVLNNNSTEENGESVDNVPVDVKAVPVKVGEDQIDSAKPVNHEQRKRYAVKEPTTEKCEPTTTTTTEVTTTELTTTEVPTTEVPTTEVTTTELTTTTEEYKHEYYKGHYGHPAVPLAYYNK